MKKTLLFLASFSAIVVMCSCADSATTRQSHAKHGRGVARITFYNKHEDKYGSRIASSRTKRARVGHTIAAESCCYPFGTRILIPGLARLNGTGQYVVEDRGKAVEKRTASKGKCPVFDIYAGSKRQMNRWVSTVPEYLTYEEL